jgi:uncharacterized membrane protein YhaH (DUF805 family)
MANDQPTRPVTLQAGARCASHPEVEAFTTCTRCGDYACVNCIGVGSVGMCDACRSRTNAASPPRAASLLQLYFGFNGRIGRGGYWLGMVSFWISLVGFFTVLNLIDARAVQQNKDVWLLAVSPLGGWVWLALSIKRWHDRDKSAAWVALAMVPGIGGPWTFVECGCLRGTLGPNRYGADPLGGVS